MHEPQRHQVVIIETNEFASVIQCVKLNACFDISKSIGKPNHSFIGFRHNIQYFRSKVKY